jgi:cytochrome c556
VHAFKRLGPAALVLVSATALGTACAPPKRDLTPDQIEKLAKLSDVMDVQATVADPQFKKISAGTFGDADWPGLADMASRIQVTSRKIHEFSKGPEFDKLADRLHAGAEALGAAVTAKDAHAVGATLAEMKATCKGCHSQFK